MISKIILQPAGNKDAFDHFIGTIKNPVNVNRIKSFLTSTQNEELNDIFEGRTTISVWGVTPGNGAANVKKWERIEPGDVTLFSRERRIFSSATVVAKIHNKSLALNLWDKNSSNETWEYIYFLDELTEQNIPYEVFNDTIGYKSNFVIQGFSILDKEKSSLLFNTFDLTSSIYFPDIPIQDYYSAVSVLDDATNLDSLIQVKGRVEQQFLRKALLGKRSAAECCICGRLLPVNLLWAAHIKKRSACSLEEKKDFKNIAAAMCKLGCDELFEKNYISVDSEGIIVNSTKIYSSSSLKEFIEGLLGRKCKNWNDDNKKYYAWHHDI